ncbi:hypothetical protein B0O80DRAFT_504285 [Mortierella sp. GBAus27b]|nr:hypothetical protein B0O80DRAFT_504285 [Mortierella sp. GBAus27b]
MAITNPFDLPEIRETLAPYLSSDDLTRCIRACRTWHDSFYPFLWTSVEIPAEQKRQPPPEKLNMHRTMVRHLVCYEYIPVDCRSINYPGLRTLQFRKIRRSIGISAILGNNPSLSHLEFHQENTHGWPTCIIPNTLSNLSTLRLNGVRLSSMDQSWMIFLQLETLELQRVSMPPITLPETLWKVNELTMSSIRRMAVSIQLKLIKQCPELRRLHWGPMVERTPLDNFARSMDTWPLLEDLCLDGSNASDQQLSIIIGNMRRVIGLSVIGTYFSIQAMSVLRSHFHSLRRFGVACSIYGMSNTACSEFTIEVLKSCPQLEHLKARGVSAEYLMDDAPWACEGSLRVLEMSFNHVINDSQHETIMGRLAKLVNLERLDVSNGLPENTITFQLRRGLGKLATLTGLRKLVLARDMQHLSMDDIEWMIQHWTSLTTIEGTLGWNHDDPQVLINRLSAAGVRTQKLVVGPP